MCVKFSIFYLMSNSTNSMPICKDFITMILEEHTFQDPESEELSPEIKAVIQQVHDVRLIHLSPSYRKANCTISIR